MIYDEESDRHVHIPFEQALHATCWGSVKDDGTTASDDMVVGDIFGFSILNKDMIDMCNNSQGTKTIAYTPTDNFATNEKLGTYLARQNYTDKAVCVDVKNIILEAIAKQIWVPLEIVICRPFIEHLMLSAVVAVAGRETGATLFGPADMRACSSVEPFSSNTRVCVVLTLVPFARRDLRQHLRQDDRRCAYKTLYLSLNAPILHRNCLILCCHAVFAGHYTYKAVKDSNPMRSPLDPFFACILAHDTHLAMDTRTRSGQSRDHRGRCLPLFPPPIH